MQKTPFYPRLFGHTLFISGTWDAICDISGYLLIDKKPTYYSYRKNNVKCINKII